MRLSVNRNSQTEQYKEKQSFATAYSLYRHAIEIALPRIAPAVEVCNKGGGLVGKLDFALALPALREAEGLLIQALSQLGQ